jgi:uncharacterized protein (TIGR02300 family)
MSNKEKRGAKRVCLSCESPFYDLHRDPITCPLCQAPFVVELKSKPSADLEEVKPVKAKIPAKELVPMEPGDGDELPDIEGGDELADIETEDAEVEPAGEDDTFLEEEEGSSDVDGLIDNPIEDEGGGES